MPPPEVIGLEWPEFLEYFKPRWEPGQHAAIIAPTGEGKTTALCGILEGRDFALALDPKGGDKTLAALGWPRLPTWPPPRKAYEDMNAWQETGGREGARYRVRVGPVVKTPEDLGRLRAVLAACLDSVFTEGGWTVAIDEFQILADPRFMNLGKSAERLLIAARNKGVSVVTLFQAPRWVPRAASDQSTWLFVGLTQDTDVVNRLGEILGRPKEEIRGAVKGLGNRRFSWLVCHQNSRHPLIVTVPEKVRPAEVVAGGRRRA